MVSKEHRRSAGRPAARKRIHFAAELINLLVDLRAKQTNHNRAFASLLLTVHIDLHQATEHAEVQLRAFRVAIQVHPDGEEGEKVQS